MSGNAQQQNSTDTSVPPEHIGTLESMASASYCLNTRVDHNDSDQEHEQSQHTQYRLLRRSDRNSHENTASRSPHRAALSDRIIYSTIQTESAQRDEYEIKWCDCTTASIRLFNYYLN
eukprot:252607_1